ncbi:psoriasis susceptibility 1 candidate gene 2 protein [Camarhynchus parvulus]|uniref:psoriasis susceptibility 1 candidate gene 2 protein n=1 Tax=Geospiza parvula TaxID=87175 RepID=UPI001237B68F|nr:psoriasis susceptibility 1 candidate gene 2 protein [Camarhynchus parvulus]
MVEGQSPSLQGLKPFGPAVSPPGCEHGRLRAGPSPARAVPPLPSEPPARSDPGRAVPPLPSEPPARSDPAQAVPPLPSEPPARSDPGRAVLPLLSEPPARPPPRSPSERGAASQALWALRWCRPCRAAAFLTGPLHWQ